MKSPLKPSTCFSNYWIYADYSKYIFQKPLAEREVGKWLFFEKVDRIDSIWEIIKNATEHGYLGPYSKVSTQKRSSENFDKNTFVICVYTEDFNNKEDINRVEKKLRDLGIKNELSYKLNKDAGKYEFQGFKNLIRMTSKFTE